MIKKAQFKCSSERISQVPKDSLKDIAFIGRSNVGKSSLINMLTRHKGLAKVSSTPGKTKLINHFLINNEWYLVDLPGYGYAKRSAAEQAKWSSLVNTYVEEAKMKCVIQLVDLKVGPTKDDIMMLDWLNANNVPYFIVATKSDKLNTTNKNKALADLRKCEYIADDADIIEFSSLKKTGKDEVWKKILSML